MATIDNQIANIKNGLATREYGSVTDFLQLCGWFGSVSVNPSTGACTVAGTELTPQQYFMLGQAMGAV